MASKRDLKKDINNVLGDVIGEALEHLDKNAEKSEAIVDEAIATFDDLIAQVNKRNVDNAKAHFKSISSQLEDKGKALLGKINKL
ncbi:hypothetical protein [Seonamhaeicola sp. ML3]|uniref:hypothetical protein n=1 Tax=Seonamhaeicola sp. ML3 TaxID=2937786 RepID=UPI00200FEB60|nr:hypothetical protein [Seonamhaeicola sp. ML3]